MLQSRQPVLVRNQARARMLGSDGRELIQWVSRTRTAQRLRMEARRFPVAKTTTNKSSIFQIKLPNNILSFKQRN